MWPFRKKPSGLSPTAINNAVRQLVSGEPNREAPRKGTVNFNMREFETHREFAGNHPLGSNGFLTLVEFSLNQSYRHCRIGKIVLKRAA